jgi:hypothetical protein
MKSTDRRWFLKLCAQSESILALPTGVLPGDRQIRSGALQTLGRCIDPLPVFLSVSSVKTNKVKLFNHLGTK